MRKVLGAAALCCGIVFSASAQYGPPAPGAAVPQLTLGRLLLVDAARVGSRIVAVGDHGFIVVSDDEGATWRRARAPEAPLLTALAFADAKHGLAVGHDAVILATEDGGDSWKQVFSAPSEQRPLLSVIFASPTHAIAAGAYGAYYDSSDGGRTWNARKILEQDKHLNGLVALGPGQLMILGEEGTILLSRDEGASWKPLPSPYKGSFFGGVLADDGAVVAYGLRGRIYRSADAGTTWMPVDNNSVAALMGSARLPDGALVLAGAAGTALVSRDAGRSFQPIQTNTPRMLAKPVLGAPNQVLLLGEAGPVAVTLPLQRAHTP